MNNLPWLISAFTMGALGSLHCIGMCGPLALTLPVQQLNGWKRTFGILNYQLGRILIYAILGMIVGLIGKGFHFYGWQQGLSIVMGIVILIAVICMFFHKQFIQSQWLQKYWNAPIVKKIAPLYQSHSLAAPFLIGVLNGLLPCGLIYMALASSLNLHEWREGALFMTSFGLGTLPAMFVLTYSGKWISLNLRQQIKKLTPIIMGIIGILLVLRGLNLDIPYISPKFEAKKVSCCHR